MSRYVSEALAIPSPGDGTDFSRADLVFDGVEHSGPSYEARVFLNNPEADEKTPLETDSGYASSFYIFGHADCFGDVGHCEVPTSPPAPFDLRLPHHLTPYWLTVIITEHLKRIRDAGHGSLTVTVVPVAYEDPDPDTPDVLAKEGVFKFEQLGLVTYD